MFKLDRATVYRVEMPLVSGWRTAVGSSMSIETIIIRVESDGVVGWGEAAPHRLPEYSAEWAAASFIALRDILLPEFVGGASAVPADAARRIDRFRGNFFAKAALDTALWSLHAVRTGRSLSSVLGGTRERVEVGADFGVLDSLDGLIEQVGRAVDRGCRRVKLKFCPGWEFEVASTVRREFPDVPTHIDCNSAYGLSDIALFKKLDTLGLTMIEQPLAHDDLLDHANLQRNLETPICLDESIKTPRDAEHAIELGSCSWINIKPGRVGGLTRAVTVHDVCRDGGVQCWVGGMLESALGARLCVALATLENMTYPSDIFPTERFFAADLATPPLRFEYSAEGWFVSADDVIPAPDPARLESWTVESASVE
jgi:O-succinylbenzoate synthase